MNALPEPTPPTSAPALGDAPSLLALEPRLGAEQRAAVSTILADAQQRIAALLKLRPEHGGLAPLHFAADLYRREPVANVNGLAARVSAYLSAEIASQPGSRYADVICAAREAAAIQACAIVTPEQVGVLREEIGREAVRPTENLVREIEALVAARGHADWESLRAALGFPDESAEWVLAELRFFAEQVIALLNARPASGLASPLDYMARLVASGDAHAKVAVAAYLEAQVEPRIGKTFAQALRDIEASWVDSLGRSLAAPERARLREVFRQNVLSVELPDRRWQRVFEARVDRMLGSPGAEAFSGQNSIAWHRFCEALLLDSAQESRALPVIRALQRDVQVNGADIDEALALEAAARAEIGRLLRADQLPRWEAFAQSSLCSIDLPE